MFQEVVSSGCGQRTEYRYLSEDGSIHHIESQSSVILDQNRAIQNVSVMFRDSEMHLMQILDTALDSGGNGLDGTDV
ncbi:MAG: hypothetical protein ACXV8O_15730 [Methylobacter sp.]